MAQVRQDRCAEFPEGPGDEAEPGQGEPGAGRRDAGAEAEGLTGSKERIQEQDFSPVFPNDDFCLGVCYFLGS
jgi:hypothetical protein